MPVLSGYKVDWPIFKENLNRHTRSGKHIQPTRSEYTLTMLKYTVNQIADHLHVLNVIYASPEGELEGPCCSHGLRYWSQ